ncbi:MAG: hypothetical protein AAFQ98_17750 [Bacteroidota bacterium]
MAKPKIQFNWGTSIALVVSFAALFTTIYEANILKSQQEAMVWPYFEVHEQYSSEGFGFLAKNSGTGPAIITSVEVTHDGKPLDSFMDLLDELSPDSAINYYNFTYRALNNTVFRAGEDRVVFFMEWTPFTRSLLEEAGEIALKVEYRSVLDDYWVFDGKAETNQSGRYSSVKEFSSSR